MAVLNIGIISDTHGLLRPEVMQLFSGVDHIIHAGDIGKETVIEQLSQIAEVTAVRGNVDTADWAKSYPLNNVLQTKSHSIYVLHNIEDLDLDPTDLFSVVIYGHSHQPKIEVKQGVLFFNPGSAGPRRFKLPIACGLLSITGQSVKPEIIQLAV